MSPTTIPQHAPFIRSIKFCESEEMSASQAQWESGPPDAWCTQAKEYCDRELNLRHQEPEPVGNFGHQTGEIPREQFWSHHGVCHPDFLTSQLPKETHSSWSWRAINRNCFSKQLLKESNISCMLWKPSSRLKHKEHTAFSPLLLHTAALAPGALVSLAEQQWHPAKTSMPKIERQAPHGTRQLHGVVTAKLWGLMH